MLRSDLLCRSAYTRLPRRRLAGRHLVCLSLLVCLLVGLVLAAPSWGQSADERQEQALAQLEERFDVVELSDGWLLQPPDDGSADFTTLEIRDGRVLLDGEEVDLAELRRFLDDDARRVFLVAGGGRLPEGTDPSGDSGESDDAVPEPPTPPAPAPSVDRERAEELAAEEMERVREQLENAIERARRGDVDREIRERLEELQDLDQMPREIDRLHRELDRLIERSERRGTRRGRDAQVTLGSNLVVERDETVSEAVVISGNLDVLGEVDGDTTVILGNARVEGFVDGTLVVVAGNIDVGPQGVIDGDAIAVGGAVHREPGGHIDGEIIHLDFGEVVNLGDIHIGEFQWPRFHFLDFGIFDALGRIVRILFLAVLALLLYVLAGAKVEEVSIWARGAPWRSLFSGLAVEIAFAPAVLVLFVLLCVSIIGLLVACLLPPLALFVLLVAFLLGYTSVALSLGDWLAERFGLDYSNRYVVILVGIAAIEIWSVFGDFVGMLPFLGWVGGLILISAWCFKFVIWTTGLGAAVLCQFSRDPAPGPVGSDWTMPPQPPPAPSGSQAAYDDAYDGADHEDVADEGRDYPLLEGDDLQSEESGDGSDGRNRP